MPARITPAQAAQTKAIHHFWPVRTYWGSSFCRMADSTSSSQNSMGITSDISISTQPIFCPTRDIR